MFPQVKGLTRETERTSGIIFFFLAYSQIVLRAVPLQHGPTFHYALATSDSIVRPIERYFPESNF